MFGFGLSEVMKKIRCLEELLVDLGARVEKLERNSTIEGRCIGSDTLDPWRVNAKYEQHCLKQIVKKLLEHLKLTPELTKEEPAKSAETTLVETTDVIKDNGLVKVRWRLYGTGEDKVKQAKKKKK